MGRWQIVHAWDYGEILETYLREGFEPFAISQDEDGYPIVWLRRETIFCDVLVKAVEREADNHMLAGAYGRN